MKFPMESRLAKLLWVFVWDARLAPIWFTLGLIWFTLGPIWFTFGTNSVHFGHFGSLLGPIWFTLANSVHFWGQLGSLWDRFGSLGANSVHFGADSVHFEPICLTLAMASQALASGVRSDFRFPDFRFHGYAAVPFFGNVAFLS